MRTTLFSTTAAILLIAITLLAPGREAAARGNILWRDCFDGYNCGTMKVPLDHSKPGGGDIEISMIRAPALDQEHKIGSLLVNFGGPGGPGIEGVLFGVDFLPQAIRDQFDIIGFDPRGVGQSTAVDCVDSFAIFNGVDPSPDTLLEIDHAVEASRAFAEDCHRRSGALIQFVNSEAAARDMDLMREELGDEKLTFLGFSYGTFLGATYAEFFPDRVRALVLDGGLDTNLTAEEDIIGQAKGFEIGLHSFLSDCAVRSTCAFKAPDREAAFDQLLLETDTTPLEGWHYPIDRDGIISATAGALYNHENWTILAEALRQAVDEGSGAGFGVMLDGVEPEEEEDIDFTNETEAFYAISCVDRYVFSGEAHYRRTREQAIKEAPRFGDLIANGNALPCVFWPNAERRIPRPYTASGAPPILVVGTLRDPATPYVWSVGLAAGLESSVLLTYDGDGHTAAGFNACIDAYIEGYLVDLVVPPSGITCANEYEPPASSPVPVVATDPPPPPTGTIRPPDTGHGPTPEGSKEGIALAVLIVGSVGGGLAVAGRRIR